MAEIVKILVAVLGPVVGLLAEPIKRQFNYLCCFNDNVRKLRKEGKILDNAKTDLEMRIDDAKNNAREIIHGVNAWLDETKEIQAELSETETKISNVQSRCWVVKSRFSLSKKAKKMAKSMKELRDRCKFDTISMSTSLASMVPTQFGKAEMFPSRKEIEEDVLKALREKNVSKMGICGMGGIGKTTMAKKLIHRVREENLYDEAFMVVVGQEMNRFNIQQQIAESLGLSLGVEALQVRAHKLRIRLTGHKRILVVVDDIWDALDLEDLGIPCESCLTGCTVLLTSRSMEVFNRMDVEVFTMKVLDKDEAWSLFNDKAEIDMDDRHLVSIAKQVANECKGLPLSLVILGSALKHKTSKHYWKDMLWQLQGSNLENIPDFLKEIYPSLKLSFDKLDSQDAENLLLLCSQYPEDSEIPLFELTMYCMSLRLFGRINSVERTRDRVFTIVDMLKSRSLLMGAKRMGFVKMHDVVRDVAIVLARKKGLVDVSTQFGETTMRSSASECKWIFMYPDICDAFHDPFVGSTYPRLTLLTICSGRIQDRRKLIIDELSFLEEMKELRSMTWKNILFELPQTIHLLENLRMLYLANCNLKRFSSVGELLGLEILMFDRCHEFEELPTEVQRLKNLKLLDITCCFGLKRIAPGIISCLVELQELKISFSFDGWESAKVNEEERKNPTLKEIEPLNKLKSLWIEIADVSLVEEDVRLPSSIVNYKIMFGNSRLPLHDFDKCISATGLQRQNICGNWINQLLQTTESLYLDGDGSQNFDLSQRHTTVKRLEIKKCGVIEKLVCMATLSIDWNAPFELFPILEFLHLENLISLKEMHIGSFPTGSIPFKNLKGLYLTNLPELTSLGMIASKDVVLQEIRIENCSKLRNLFLARAKDMLSQLKSLEIHNCKMMEEVLCCDENQMDSRWRIVFPKMETLKLRELSSLTAFSRGMEYIEFPLLTSLHITSCPKFTRFVSSSFERDSNLEVNNDNEDHLQLFDNRMVAFGRLKILQTSILKFNDTSTFEISRGLFTKVEELTIVNCVGDTTQFSSSMGETFQNIKTLEIHDCSRTKKVFANETNEVSFEFFPSLKTLDLSSLPDLEEICDTMILESSNAFKNLETLNLSNLPALKYLFQRPIQWILVSNLYSVSIGECNELPNLFPWTIPEDRVLLLEFLIVASCERMVHIFSNNENGDLNGNSSHITFSKLKGLYFRNMTSLETFYEGVESLGFPALEGLTIEECPNFVSICKNDCATTNEHGNVSFHLFCSEKVALGRLKTLEIYGYHYLNMWCHKIPHSFFKQLTHLTICDCNGVTTLFSSSIVENLVNLDMLHVRNCKKIERVIANQGVRACNKHLHFPSLDYLKLNNLPLLRNFCESECVLELSSLTIISIDDCPSMEFFNLGAPTSTPILVDVYLNKSCINVQGIDVIDGLNGIIHRGRMSTTMSMESSQSQNVEVDKMEENGM